MAAVTSSFLKYSDKLREPLAVLMRSFNFDAIFVVVENTISAVENLL